MRAPVPLHYHGNKARFARQIAQMLLPHTTYVEPFAGSAALLFAKPPSVVEVLNDLDGAVCAFFEALRDHRDELIEACRLTPYSRAEHAACVAGLDAEGLSVVERARRLFVATSQGFGAIATTTGWTRPVEATSEARKVGGLVDRFAVCADRLRGVHLECRPASEVIAAYDDPTTLMYVDPPYLWSVRSWADAQQNKRDYRVEMQADDEHDELLGQLNSCESIVVLSGKASPLYEARLHEWYSVTLGDGEVIWSNQPLAMQSSLF